MIRDLEHVKLIKKKDQVLFKRYKRTVSCQTQKKAFFRENPVSLFQVKMDDHNSVNPVATQVLLELYL